MALSPFWPGVLVGVAVLGLVAYALWRGRRGVARPTPAQWRRFAIGVLVVLAALRPGFAATTGQGRATDLDVVIMLDRSLSMVAEDYHGSQPRLVGAKADVRLVLERFAGARFSIVTFDHVARVELPPTTDTTAVMSLVNVAGPRAYYNKGSSIDAGVAAAEGVLKASAEKFPNRQRFVVYLGDGEQTAAAAVGSFAGLRQYVSGAVVLGYGTTSGGRMKVNDRYERDYQAGSDALSRIDEGNLRTIAQQLGGRYEHRTAPGPLSLPLSGVRGSGGLGLVSARDDWSWLVALLLLAPVLWEMWDAATGRRAAVRMAGARERTAVGGARRREAA